MPITSMKFQPVEGFDRYSPGLLLTLLELSTISSESLHEAPDLSMITAASSSIEMDEQSKPLMSYFRSWNMSSAIPFKIYQSNLHATLAL